jgi:hypothetical protein
MGNKDWTKHKAQQAPDYEAMEREHFGDPDKRTGIYAIKGRNFPLVPSGSQVDALLQANAKLAGAIEMIRETLDGGKVDDILHIINTALAEHRATFTLATE